MISGYEEFPYGKRFYFTFETDHSIVKFEMPLPEFRYFGDDKIYLTAEISNFVDALENNMFCTLRFQNNLKFLLDDELIVITYYETNTSIEIRSVAATRYQLRDTLGKYLKFVNNYD